MKEGGDIWLELLHEPLTSEHPNGLEGDFRNTLADSFKENTMRLIVSLAREVLCLCTLSR